MADFLLKNDRFCNSRYYIDRNGQIECNLINVMYLLRGMWIGKFDPNQGQIIAILFLYRYIFHGAGISWLI